MATQSDLITKYRSRPAFKGLSNDTVGELFDNALEAIAEYQPQKVILRDVRADAEDGIYDVPSDAREIVRLQVSSSNARIDFEVFYNDTADGGRKIQIGQVRLPSFTDLVNDEDDRILRNYTNNQIHRGVYGGTGYDSFDIIYSRTPTFESLHEKHHLALRLYAEHLAYEEKSESIENSVDITDQDAAGESTTIRHSQRGTRQYNLSKDKNTQFLREMRRPFWSRNSLGIVERIWTDTGTY